MKIMMYMLLIISLIVSILARSDFISIMISVYVFVLFLFQSSFNEAPKLKTFLQINLGAVVYDIIWLVFHFQGYWSGNSYEYAEITLKKWTYFFSFINLLVKIFLLISVWVSYDKMSNPLRSGNKKSSIVPHKNLSSSVGKFKK
jgi:hypothetical protein